MKSRLLSVLFMAGVVVPGLQAQLCVDCDNAVFFSLPESQDINPYNYTLLVLESSMMLTDMLAHVYDFEDVNDQDYIDYLSSQAIREAYHTSLQPFSESIKELTLDTIDLLKQACACGYNTPEATKKKLAQHINDLVAKIVPYMCDILQKDGSPEALRLSDDIKLIQEDIKTNIKDFFD